jgi:hypothetical protein
VSVTHFRHWHGQRLAEFAADDGNEREELQLNALSEPADLRFYKLGPLTFSLSGRDPILPYLQREIAPLEVPSASEPRLTFEFDRELPEIAHHVRLPPLDVGSDYYLARHSGLEYHVSANGEWLRVRIRSAARLRLERLAPRWLRRTVDWNYLLPYETVAKNFMYDVFDYLSQLAHLSLGASYVHASSFERDGRGVAIVAWGGAGKTTTMLKLVAEDSWRFLSDDLGLVDESGVLWRTPKHLQVYAYNVQGQDHLYRTLMAGRSLLDRAAWWGRALVLGPKLVRRRVSAESLFGATGVAKSAPLTDLFFLERADVRRFDCRSISTEELIRRAATTLLKEMQPMGDLTAAMYSGEWHPILPPQDQFVEAGRAILAKAFSHVEPRLIRVPLSAGPDALADYIRGLLNRS